MEFGAPGGAPRLCMRAPWGCWLLGLERAILQDLLVIASALTTGDSGL